MDTHNILEKINKACLKFLVPLSLEETYATIVDEAIKLVDCDDGLIVRNFQGNLKTVYGSSVSAASYQVRQDGNSRKSLNDHKIMIMQYDEIKRLPTRKTTDVLSVIFVPLSYKDLSEGVLILRSKNEKHFSEKEMRILELFGSFASLAVKKNELYEETKSALEVRDKFISLASHELRTPLTSINGYIQLLHSRIGQHDTSEAKWVRELYSESKRMTNLVHELLEINRIKQGQLQFILRETHITDIVTQAIHDCQITNEGRKLTLLNKLQVKNDIVIGDSDKLLKVVSALIENALKFSPEHSEVLISLSSKQQFIVLRVSDKGSGIAREDMAKIFDGFYKVNDNQGEGMGVGLLLAKHIIQHHKGMISVQSEVKKGTTVEVRLPQQKL
jgi:K+-sensing histidine kinase KdpD